MHFLSWVISSIFSDTKVLGIPTDVNSSVTQEQLVLLTLL